HGGAEEADAARVGGHELRPFRRPAARGAHEDPGGADAAVVPGAAEDGRLPVGGEGDPGTGAGRTRLVGRQELGTAAPARAAASVDPGRAEVAVRAGRADHGRRAVAGEREARAERVGSTVALDRQ